MLHQVLHLLLHFLYLLSYEGEKRFRDVTDESDFAVIWSVPFQSCVKGGAKTADTLRQAGVQVNRGDTFQGDRIASFYTLGLYPFIGPKGDVNGGIPQLADLNGHLVQSQHDIETVIPERNFSGLALIDWESWRPVWEFNFGTLTVYQKRSLLLVQEQHPDWSHGQQLKEATRQWEHAARVFMESTLKLAKYLRPRAHWCYYGFPDCYNYNGQERPEEFFCSGNIMQGNDKLQWLWDQSSALCPSIYIRKSQFLQYNLTQRSWYTYGRLQEALRVGGYAKPIYPYINYFIFDAGKTVPQHFLPPVCMCKKKMDFQRLLSMPESLGMSGVVIWGSSKNVRTKADCQTIDSFVEKVISPSVQILKNQSDLCATEFCQDAARWHCVWTKPAAYDAWKMLISASKSIDPTGMICMGRQFKQLN